MDCKLDHVKVILIKDYMKSNTITFHIVLKL